MRVWSQLSSPNRQYFKDMTIHKPQSIHQYITYLNSLKQTNQHYKHDAQSIQRQNNKSSSKPKTQTLHSINQHQQQQDAYNTFERKKPGDQMIQLLNEDGKIQNIPIRNIKPMAKLQSMLQSKLFNPSLHLYINQRQLGTLKTQIMQKCKSIPVSQIIIPPNIISMIQSKSHNSPTQQKRFKSSQKRSLFFPINNRIHLELINNDIPIRQLTYQTIKNPYYKNQLKQLNYYYERKIQQLLIDKELTTVSLFILVSNFFTQKQPQGSNTQQNNCVKYFPLTQKKYIYSFFNFIESNKTKFWPYQCLSLKSIFTLNDIFFNKIHTKFSFYFDSSTQSIQKIQFTPFVRFQDSPFEKGFQQIIFQTHKNSNQNELSFKGIIFYILIRASQQMKAYYKIPDIISSANLQLPQSSNVTLQDLIETMSQVGFKMSEISSILRNFALIMNILLLELEEKQEKMNQFSKFKMGLQQNIGYKNIRSLYSGHLPLIQFILLNQQFNVTEHNSSTLIKKQILATILWQLAINRFANQINSKIQNISKDLSKTKKFQIFCHYNSQITQNLDQNNFIEDGTYQQTQYQIIGEKLVEKQFVIDDQKQDQTTDNKSIKSKQSSFSRNKNKKIDSPASFRKFIQNAYQSAIDKDFTSFNSVIINTRRASFKLYNLMRSSSEVKKMAQQIFHLSQFQECSEKYWNQFFQNGKNNDEIIQNDYIICGDYYSFVHQQKNGKNILNFCTKLIAELIQHLDGSHQNQMDNLIDDDSQKLLSDNQINKLSALTPKSQMNNQQKFPPKSPRQLTRTIPLQSNQKKILFIQTQNLQSLQQQQSQSKYQSSIMKTPKRQIFSIQLSHLVSKYLYGDELKQIYRFFKQISEDFLYQMKQYDPLKIYNIMEQSIIEINELKNMASYQNQNKKTLTKKLNDNQLKKLSEIQFFDLFYDVCKESHYIQATENMFFKIQQQTNLQKQAARKIICLFRAHKFRKNHKIFIFRKKFLKNIHKLCRLAIFSKKYFDLIERKCLQLTKESYSRLRLKFSMKKLMGLTFKLYQTTKSNLKSQSFTKIKRKSKFLVECQKIYKSCQKMLLKTKEEAMKLLKPASYSVMITSPTGTRKNLDVLQINVQNVNDTSVVHSGNMSTSNVKNLLNKGDDKKSFATDEKKPFSKKDSPQQVNVKNGHETDNAVIEVNKQNKKIPNNSASENQNPKSNEAKSTQIAYSSSLKQPPALLQQKPEKLQKIQEIIEQRSQLSRSKVSELKNSKVSELSNDIVSVLNSGMSGSLVSCKSEHSQKLTKNQLFTLKDSPFFSFESWSKQTKTVHQQSEITKPLAVLFRKLEAQKIKINEQTPLIVDEDVLLKQKIVNASFVGYLKQNINKSQYQTVQQRVYHQQRIIQKPLLKHYSVQKHGQFFKETFNHILKISLFKNTSKKLFQLLNLLLKPIRDIYRKQKSTQQTVFEDEPLVINSYESVYNLYRDQMFVQFAKQLMGNTDEESLNSITFVLQIITKNYFPSPKLFYGFLNFIKSNQISKPQLYSKIYENLIRFAQALQGYKGLHIRLYKQEPYKLTQLEYHEYLQPRQSSFVSQECKYMANKIIINLFNGQKFEFIIRNQTLRTVKKRILVQLGFLKYQKNFALYEEQRQKSYVIVSQKQKAIDFLSRKAPNLPILTLRISQYYPIKFADINALRMFYLNQISQQILLPFKPEEYEHIVALGISFDEFQEIRIGNYMFLSKKEKLGDQELQGIKNKLQIYAQVQGDKRICQFQYFKTIKQFNFLLAKSYKVLKQKSKFMQQIDKLVVKPKQLCFYAQNLMRSSLSLYRIKSFYFQNEEIHIELIYSDRDLSDGHDKRFHGLVKSLTLTGFGRMTELYEDIVYYTQLLQLGKTK